MNWEDILKEEPEGVDYESIKENLDFDVTKVMADIANDYFGEFGIRASNDSFESYNEALDIIFKSIMSYVKSHDDRALHYIDREDLR
jgi:hypothetical protein